MPTVEKRVNGKINDECVLFIGAESDTTARIFVDLRSATEEQYRVEWITDFAGCNERLRAGGVVAVVMEAAPHESRAVDLFNEVVRVAPDIPVLVLCEPESADTIQHAVQAAHQDYQTSDTTDSYQLSRILALMLERRNVAATSRENELTKFTLDSIGEAVIRIDVTGKITYLNRVAEMMSGWLRAEALGRPVEEVVRILNGDTGLILSNLLEDGLQTNEPQANRVLLRRDGLEFGIENKVTPLRDAGGVIVGWVLAFHDVSVARASSHQMSHLAHHDFLTGLPNRMLFNDRLSQAISLSARQKKQLAVMFVDLDHFKKVNDSLGHSVGDRLLQSVANRLISCVRRTDTVSRLGGDEFVVLLSQVEHEEDAAFSARKILRVLATPHTIDSKSLHLSASIGVSTYPSDGVSAADLMKRADTAMYEAKQRGRNIYKFYKSDMHTRLTERRSLEGDLRYALGRGEFLLHFQPKYNLKTKRITGTEALLRWQHPQRGLISPADFLPIADECGLMLPIGRWVLLEACSQARAWRQAGLENVPVAVNVSAAEFTAKDFLSGVRAALIATGLQPRELELELTETVLMEEAEAAVVTMRALKAMGVRLAIDDFGTGYSSFTYLRRFPADVLKIHQSFIHDITEDAADATIVGAMINIGKSLKQCVIAEGVETQAQVDFLCRYDCDEGQGFLLSRPIPAGQLVNHLQLSTLALKAAEQSV